MRLIDADALERVGVFDWNRQKTTAVLASDIAAAQTVCCAECRHFFWKEENWGDCHGGGLLQPREDQFCAYFKRRTG